LIIGQNCLETKKLFRFDRVFRGSEFSVQNRTFLFMFAKKHVLQRWTLVSDQLNKLFLNNCFSFDIETTPFQLRHYN
jgi:hypothetical protein